jgi:hypothetical protein
MGILTVGFSGSGRQREGLAAASSSYCKRWPVVGLPGGSPTRARGKMVSWWPGDAPRPDGRAREVANWWGDGGRRVSKATA